MMTGDDRLSSPLNTILTADLLARLQALAARTDRPIDDCVQKAVADYCDTWEEYHDTVDRLLREEDHRRSLRVVNE